MKLLTFAALALLALSPAGFAVPMVTIVAGNDPSNDLNNVLFTTDTVGTTVQGTFNGSSNLINFTSTSTLDSGTSNGQARVAGANGTSFTDLSFSLAGGTLFQTAVLNINAVNAPQQPDGNVLLSVAFIDDGGNPMTQQFTLSSGGQNFFTIQGIDGALISSVSLLTGAGATIQDVRQVRIGFAAPTNSVPDNGSTLMLLGGSLLGFALIRRAVLNATVSA